MSFLEYVLSSANWTTFTGVLTRLLFLFSSSVTYIRKGWRLRGIDTNEFHVDLPFAANLGKSGPLPLTNSYELAAIIASPSPGR